LHATRGLQAKMGLNPAPPATAASQAVSGSAVDKNEVAKAEAAVEGCHDVSAPSSRAVEVCRP